MPTIAPLNFHICRLPHMYHIIPPRHVWIGGSVPGHTWIVPIAHCSHCNIPPNPLATHSSLQRALLCAWGGDSKGCVGGAFPMTTAVEDSFRITNGLLATSGPFCIRCRRVGRCPRLLLSEFGEVFHHRAVVKIEYVQEIAELAQAIGEDWNEIARGLSKLWNVAHVRGFMSTLPCVIHACCQHCLQGITWTFSFRSALCLPA